MDKLRMSDLGVVGRTVLLRTDYNVPVYNGSVIDDQRIAASLPTLTALRAAGARVVVATHRADLRNQVTPEMSTLPLATHLAKLVGCDVGHVPACVGPEVTAAVATMPPGGILMLENLRLHPGEEANSGEFAAALAGLADVYVDDAFGSLHLPYASIVGVPRHIPAAAGPLVTAEVEALERAAHPARPAALVLGGVKFEDRLPLIEYLLPEIDVLCMGGLVGVSMLAALGLDIAGVEVSAAGRTGARRIIEAIRQRPDFRLVLPHAVVATDGRAVHTMSPAQVPPNWTIVDTGWTAVKSFEQAITGCHSAVWNGPMGLYTQPPFDAGTNELAIFLAELNASVVAAGVATSAAARRSGMADGFDMLSGGGGTALRLLSGQPIVGLEALPTRTR